MFQLKKNKSKIGLYISTPFIFLMALFVLGFKTPSPHKKNYSAKDDSTKAHQIIENYISAIGGKKNLGMVEDRITYMHGNIDSTKIEMTIYQKAPDLLRQKIKIGSVKEDVYFDDKSGVMYSGGKSFPIKGPELEKLKYESYMKLLLNFDTLGIKLKYDSLETLNGEKAYRVEMILPYSFEWTQYYNTKTNLKLKEVKEIDMPAEQVTQETIFSDYKDVNGVKYPFKLIQNIGPQTFHFEVDSIKINTGIKDNLFQIP
jgi:zinc protease